VKPLKFQNWTEDAGRRPLLLFEGRDATGNGDTIKRCMEHLNPRYASSRSGGSRRWSWSTADGVLLDGLEKRLLAAGTDPGEGRPRSCEPGVSQPRMSGHARRTRRAGAGQRRAVGGGSLRRAS
jgi:hypothetical protein